MHINLLINFSTVITLTGILPRGNDFADQGDVKSTFPIGNTVYSVMITCS